MIAALPWVRRVVRRIYLMAFLFPPSLSKTYLPQFFVVALMSSVVCALFSVCWLLLVVVLSLRVCFGLRPFRGNRDNV